MYYSGEKRGLYRSRHGMVFGVCRGIAERLDVSVFWTRILVLVAFIFSGFWPIGAIYLLLALLLKKEPVGMAYVRHSGVSHTADRCRHAEGSLDERMQRMQSTMNHDMHRWDMRLHENQP